MLEFKFDTQLLIEGHDLDEDVINDYFTNNFKGDCLLAVGDDELIKIHYHTNEPWKVLEGPITRRKMSDHFPPFFVQILSFLCTLIVFWPLYRYTEIT